ncbi:transcription factor IIA, alpha/beta subunit [Absidia repens]|uniref:Transcription initiation factor IIA large subunit n=1 Tax=Absidia repens TaxID=90262 RepID=A0A1X2I5W8_9FUNG|nr:transcription factor IIA, alpha/beta subunit [Absidia repens]
MSNSIVTNVYRYVIDDVINQVRAEFEDMGIDEAVLQELQRSWETKVARSRVANFGFNNEGYYEDEGDQNNVNNDADKPAPTATTNAGNSNNNAAYSEAYSQAGAPATVANLATIANSGARNALRPPNTLQQHQSQPPNTSSSSSIPYSLPPTNMPHLPPVNGAGQYPPMNLHQPQQLLHHQQQQQQQQQQPTLPDLHLPGGGRPNIPQNDGANDVMTTAEIDAHLDKRIMDTHDSATSAAAEEEEEDGLSFSATTFSGDALAMDGLPEHIKLLMKDARERAIQAGAMSSKTRIAQLDGEVDDNDDINSDLDDSDDDDDDPEGGEEIEHIILCLYDKVTRTKNKWKCVLKDGIMLVNGRDYLFHRGNGDFEW